MNQKIIKLLRDRYAIGTPLEVVRLVAGEENNNFKVVTANESYVLRLYGRVHSFKGERVNEQLEIEYKFMEQARTVGISVPKIVKNIDDEPFGFDDVIKRFYGLFVYEDLGATQGGFTNGIVSEIAGCIDNLYIASEQLVQSNSIEARMELSIVSRTKKLYTQLVRSSESIPTEIRRLYESCLRTEADLAKLKLGVVHGDVKLQNMLFDNEKLVALLDFDDCRVSYILEDCVMALMHNLNNKPLCLLRSGYSSRFISELKCPRLKDEISIGLSELLRWRLLYEFVKLYTTENEEAFRELLKDSAIVDLLTEKEIYL